MSTLNSSPHKVAATATPQPLTSPAFRTSPSPRWPALFLALLFFALTILAWPDFVEKVVLLKRLRINLRPCVYAFEALCGTLAIATFLLRERVNTRFRKIFPSGKHFAIAAILLCSSIIFGALVSEGLARVLNFPFRPQWAPSENPLARFDPELGWSYIPNQSVTQEFGADHRPVNMYFDDLGCRVAKAGDHSDRQAPTALFVGDSYTFGHGVTYEESFVGRLARNPDFPLQVVNLGVQAYGTDQTLLLLKRQFDKFNTKLVVFTFTSMQLARNELYDRRVQFPAGLFLGTKPLFALHRDGSLYLAKAPVEFKDYRYSHLWAAFQVFELRHARPNLPLTRALIKEMKDFVEAHGARFVVVDWFNDKDFPWGLDLDVIRVAANAPPDWDKWVIPVDTHPDAHGNLFAAEWIAKELQPRLANDILPHSPSRQ